MEYRILGNTGIRVSRLCFGALTIGPLQADLSPEKGGAIIRRALDGGVNFIDTAELYGTYPHIRQAISGMDSQDIIIASKSYEYTYEGMEASLRKALDELGVERMGLYLLHEQESYLTLKGHRDALCALVDAKKKGLVRAIGISTHAVEAVKVAAQMDEIDVIHPMLNFRGIGILDGTIDEMVEAVEGAAAAGKGIYAMKALGGGNLLNQYNKAIDFVRSMDFVSSVAMGMQTMAEVEMNLRVFGGEEVPQELKEQVARQPRRLFIEDWCQGCGSCVERCQHGAISLVDGKAQVSMEKCVLCSYCASVCKDFCIKII